MEAIHSTLSDHLSTAVIFATTALTVAYYLNRRSSGLGFKVPPGPAAVPFFGNALALKSDDDFLNQMIGWAKEYGPVYSIYLGQRHVVVVNGMEAVKEVTVKTGLDFGDRGQGPIDVAYNPKRYGLFDTPPGDAWKNQRRFALTTLKGMGFGKVALEPLITDEANKAIEYYRSKSGAPMNPQVALGVSASNIISRLIFTRGVEHGSDVGDTLMQVVREIMNSGDEGVLLTLMPWAWPVLKHSTHWKEQDRAYLAMMELIDEEIKIREERINTAASPGAAEINDFLEAYLVQRRTDPENFSIEAVYMTLFDLFLAGTDTVSTTLTWSIVYLVTNPDIQRKIHDEIMAEVGTGQVTLAHRSGLPYTQAALIEIQRLATVAPLIPRRSIRDASIGEYRLPKGTDVFINFWSLHHDPEVWSDPNQFRPERFLEADGTLMKHPENFLPFSAGKRVCMGEQLAKMELFLFFTSLVQQLKFSVPDGQDPPSYESDFPNTVRQPKPFQVTATAWPDE